MLGSGYVAPFAEATPSGGTPYGPAFIQSLNPAAWFRYGMGITVVTGVSQWSDQTANARHLLQATGANQPALQADNSILFDGVAHFLKCNAFTLNQPETIYLLMQEVSFTGNDVFFDGNALGGGRVFQIGAVSQINFASNTSSTGLGSHTIGGFQVWTMIFNSPNSQLFLTPTSAGTTSNTRDSGANNMGGFTLGADGTPGNFSNIQVKEAILFASAHDESVRAGVIRYLAAVGGLAV